MPKTDLDPLGGEFRWRLRAELNRVQPRWSSPRYLSQPRQRIRAWRFGPAGVVAGVVGMLALTAYAATGSTNPVVWTQKIVTTIEPNVVPESTPAATPSRAPSPRAAVPAPPAPTHQPQPTPRTEAPEPGEFSPRPQPSGSPEPGDHPPSPSPSPSPSPPPPDH